LGTSTIYPSKGRPRQEFAAEVSDFEQAFTVDDHELAALKLGKEQVIQMVTWNSAP
jgi:hypothetical protein